MKKALTKVLLTAITLVIFAAIIPLSASANTSNKAEVYRILTEKLKFNSAAACGIMANIERESDFDPTCVGVDSNGLISGGLCQWNGGRFTNLQNYCSKKGLDYMSIEGQLSYLLWEKETDSYGYIFDYLYSVPNSAEGAYNAAYYWCYYYEIPSNASSKSVERGNIAREDYWPVYGKIDLKSPKLSLLNKKSPYDTSNVISFKWSSAGNDVTTYYLYITQRNSSGKYDWSKAMVGKYNPSTTKINVGASSLSSGNFAAIVKAYNSQTGKIVNSNYMTFSIKCTSHKYTSKVIKKATLTQQGVKLYTCTICGAQVKKAIPVLAATELKKITPANLKITGYNATQIRLSWNKISGVDGYRIYQKTGGKWVACATVKGESKTSVIISNLATSKRHYFAYRAYIVTDNGVCWSATSNYITAATRPAATKFTKLSAGSTSVSLAWAKVNNIDGYAVYISTGGAFKLAKLADADDASCTIKSLKKGQAYKVAIRPFIKVPSGYVVSKASPIVTFTCK